MAVFAVYIEKSASFQGERRPFGNTYHFSTDFGQVFQDEAVALEVAAAEKQITSSLVRFDAWRTWGPTDGTEFDNVMREDGVLDGGNGQGGTPSSLFLEQCFLAVWPLSRSAATNRKRWLRKFVRGAWITGITSTIVSGQAPIGATEIASVETDYIVPVTSVVTADGYELCTATGDLPTGPGVLRPYYITRQIGS